jgi:hypothetical protein
MMKIEGSGSASGFGSGSESGSRSISKRHGFVDPGIRIHTKMSWICKDHNIKNEDEDDFFFDRSVEK